MKEDIHIFQGMKRDSHPSKQDANFLWDAHNIRLTNRDGDTLLALTNEKGNSRTSVSFEGQYVGHCVLGKYLVVFTYEDDSTVKSEYFYRIYRTEKTSTGYITILLLEFSDTADGGAQPVNGWLPEHPIETLGDYETELIQKVYWVDGVHQPRMINITKPELVLSEEIQEKVLVNGSNLSKDYSEDGKAIYEGNSIYSASTLDFSPSLDLNEEVIVYEEGSGEFSPGTIQYSLTYYNKYGQESAIFYTSPLYYIAHKTRGASPEEKVSTAFTVDVTDLDKTNKFDYIRLYSIHRTSIDAEPTVKLVQDIRIKPEDFSATFHDNGIIGEIVDPTKLILLGNKSIKVSTLTSKSGTLFLGGILQIDNNFADIKNLLDSKLKDTDVQTEGWGFDTEPSNIRPIPKVREGEVYYDNPCNLHNGYQAYFKAHEYYKCGIQFQYATGEWSEPYYIGRRELNNAYPWVANIIGAASVYFSPVILEELRNLGVKNIRTCVSFPKLAERRVLCQGVLNPTVYNVGDRMNNRAFSLSSWFFRPAISIEPSQVNVIKKEGSSIEYRHNESLGLSGYTGGEIQLMDESWGVQGSVESAAEHQGYFFVDTNTVTFHSPDVEFDTQFQNTDLSNLSLGIVAMAPLGAIYGDISLEASAGLTTEAKFIHKTAGYTIDPANTKSSNINGGLIATPNYYDALYKTKDSDDPGDGVYWMIYPWHKTGAINNGVLSTKVPSLTSELQTKTISNLKFFTDNIPIFTSNASIYDISTPQLFTTRDEVAIIKYNNPYNGSILSNYLGNVDYLVSNTKSTKYTILGDIVEGSTQIKGIDNDDGKSTTTFNSPVRIKYKSTNHLMFTLGSKSNTVSNNQVADTIQILPNIIQDGTGDVGYTSELFNIPLWWGIESSSTYEITSGDIAEVDPKFGGKAATSKKDLDCYYISASGLTEKETGKRIYHVYIMREKGKERVSNKTLKLRYISGFTRSVSRDTDHLPPYTAYNQWVKNNTPYYVYLSIQDKYVIAKPVSDNASLYVFYEVGEIDTPIGGELNDVYIEQRYFKTADEISRPYLLIGELFNKDIEEDEFIQSSSSDTKDILWLPASDPFPCMRFAIYDDEGEVSEYRGINVPFEYGDTWYSRYDCLKTYPFTPEDENQIVEIGSFLCETRVNIDGRYDRGKEKLSHLTTTPQSFNLLNEVYNQKDNFFNYRILDGDFYKIDKFSNQVTWSLEKHAGEDVDPWTNVTLANTLDMPGNKGEITALRLFNDNLICFQKKAISKILFNERTQIPVTDGVPIEISNGYKVGGSVFMSDSVGCQNKWSIVEAPSGLYFVDNNTDTIWRYGSKLENLSDSLGMRQWVVSNHTLSPWSPLPKSGNNIRSYYDAKYDDVYFVPGIGLDSDDEPVYKEALCYSGKLGQFTSFMSYGKAIAMFNIEDSFFAFKQRPITGENTRDWVDLWKNFDNDNNTIFGDSYPCSLSFISNKDPMVTKVFDNVDYSADIFRNGELTPWTFSSIEVENEYQSGKISDKGESLEHKKNFRRKFRRWRVPVPRSSKVAEVNGSLLRNDIGRTSYGRARIRNPWAKITLTLDNTFFNKLVLNDVIVRYTD